MTVKAEAPVPMAGRQGCRRFVTGVSALAISIALSVPAAAQQPARPAPSAAAPAATPAAASPATDPAALPRVRGQVTVSTSDGYARLLFHFEEDVEAQIKVNGLIVVMTFKRPVDVAVDRLNAAARDYISASRIDPDGRGIRLALSRKLTVSTLPAGERLYVDLLPPTWVGMPPGLPTEVIEELARRAREAEKRERQKEALARQRKLVAIRVRVAQQPTFTRYTFELPSLVSVQTDRAKEKLSLTFDAPMKFDLADAQALLPPMVQSIESAVDPDTATVRFNLIGRVDVRTFREDNNYVVDVGTGDGAEISQKAMPIDMLTRNAVPPIDRPATVPARGAPTLPALAAPPPELPVPPSPAPQARTEPAAAAPKPEVASPRPAGPAAPSAEIKAEPGSAAPATAEAPSAIARPEVAKPEIAKPEVAKPEVAKPEAAKPEAAKPDGVKPDPGRADIVVPPVVAPFDSVPVRSSSPIDRATAPAPESPKPEAAPPAIAKPDAGLPANSAPRNVAAPAPQAPRRDPAGRSVVELTRDGENLQLLFPFAKDTPAALFWRGDALWLVLDSDQPVDIAPLKTDPTRTIVAVERGELDGAQVLRLKLGRPRLVGIAAEGTNWAVTLGDSVAEPSQPLAIGRNLAGTRASITVPFDNPRVRHELTDPEVGDKLIVVTALGPPRGLLKPQDFVDFRALASVQGLVVQKIADDLAAELAADKVVIGRPNGLTLSQDVNPGRRSSVFRQVVFDAQSWGYDRQANYAERQAQLTAAAAAAPETKRGSARLDLARFYMAREMYPEARGVLNVTLAGDNMSTEDTIALVLRGVNQILMNRPDEGLKDLAHPLIGNQYDAPIWRAYAHALEGKWAEAREGFKGVEQSMAALPVELQRLVLREAMRAALEGKDYNGASKILNEFEMVGVSREMEPGMAVLSGQLAEGLGRTADALASYRNAADSWDRPSAARGRLRELMLRFATGDIKRMDLLNDLEALTTIWRGDATEVEALAMMARLYTEENRYRDAFNVMRTALKAHPNSDLTRKIHDEAAATFDSLFLAGKGDALPAIDALSLFYDFRELTPIGRRGDEMIRRLADRLVSVDLLDQAAELLQYQVDHRLQGAARAQIAARLAVIYLMNRKPDRALEALRATRLSELTSELRSQRLLLEARALSDIGRADTALEVIANLKGREVERLRSDVSWKARRWQKSAEQMELLYGDRWKEFQPLSEVERRDILRAAIGYALADDQLGLARFRERYVAKMAEGPDRRAFDVVTAPVGASGQEFTDVAKTISAVDTLQDFLRDLNTRYPETGSAAQPLPGAPATPPRAAPADPQTTSSVPPRRPPRTATR